MSQEINSPSLQPLPTPYEYALISQLTYTKEDNLHEYAALGNKLAEKGWALKDPINENGYYADIWVNDSKKQIVIAHRGSQNATSWITDYESVIQLKSGTFVESAVKSLVHPMVKEYRQAGYRLSTTGHSLGGFLAQICVFWSQRREMTDTYYPDMSAVVFDSPGAADFLETLKSNLESEKGSIKIETLNIHNFCGMPTVVSTFGAQTGTIWHLSDQENIKFAFVNNHKMKYILKGFDTSTGYPKDFRQMLDWPQANYSGYLTVSDAISSVKNEAIKLPFTFLNYFYKNYIKSVPTDTWFDQVFREEGQVASFLKATKESGNRPSLDELNDVENVENKVTLAIKSHYSTYMDVEHSQSCIGLHHFDREVQKFLFDLTEIRAFISDNSDLLNNELAKTYGHEGLRLLSQCSVQEHGNKIEVVLNGYQGSVFDFQNELLLLLNNNSGILNIRQLIGDTAVQFGTKLSELQEDLKDVKEGSRLAKQLQGEIEELQAKVEQLNNCEQALNNSDAKTGRLFTLRTAIANVPGANANRFLAAIDYEPGRTTENVIYMQHAKDGDAFHMDGAVSNKINSDAYVFPKDISDSQLKALAYLKRDNISAQINITNDEENQNDNLSEEDKKQAGTVKKNN